MVAYRHLDYKEIYLSLDVFDPDYNELAFFA
jgi:hypothetical protein